MARITFTHLVRRRFLPEHGRDVAREGDSYELTSPFIVGRGCSHEHVRLVDTDTVSRRHVTLDQRADGWWIRDNGSTNGTRVGGDPISERKLVDGDVVALGVGTPEEPEFRGAAFRFSDP